MTDQQKPHPQKKKLDNVPFIQMLYSLESSTNELEKAWSESLNEENVKKAHTELLTLWESFTRNFPAWTEAHGTKLKELGFDTTIKQYPLDDDGFRSLGEQSALIDRYNQFSIASLYQTQNLLRALTAIKDPSHKETTFPSGSIESWWEASAFSLIRSSVRSLAFTLEQQTDVYEELTKEPHKRNVRPTWMQYMDTLRVILNNELYEAAPPIVIGAIRSLLAERAGISVDNLPADLVAKLGKVKTYETLAHLYGELEKLCLRIGFETIPDRGYLVPLIIGSATQLSQLISQPLKSELLEELRV